MVQIQGVSCCWQTHVVGLQIAALMSGKHSLRVEDLYSVCAHWQQMAGPHHKVLQNFGSSDLVASCQHIHRVLG